MSLHFSTYYHLHAIINQQFFNQTCRNTVLTPISFFLSDRGRQFSSKNSEEWQRMKKNHLRNFVFLPPRIFFSSSGKFPLGVVQKRKWLFLHFSLSQHRMKWNKKSKFSCSWDVLRWRLRRKAKPIWGDGKCNCNFSRFCAFEMGKRKWRLSAFAGSSPD